MRNVVVLGSTGSVGRSALDVIASFPDAFRVTGLSAHRSADLLVEQAKELRPPRVACVDPAARGRVEDHLGGDGIAVLGGTGGLEEMAQAPDTDVVLNSIVGVAGLGPALAALRAGKTLAVANKEPLVAAGPIMAREAAAHGATILPVDSEHSAIFQALRSGRAGEVRRIILTASGGPFRTRPVDTFADITPEEALRHPTWSMGPKITVDSATMMNKALEVIEAVSLFAVPAEKIRVVIHPQSVVHSMVEFHDGSVVAQMGRPDMRLPVLFALSWPDRLPWDGMEFDVADYSTLTFEDPDPDRYPALDLGFRAAGEGGLAGAVLNAANERAVEAFLAGEIPFTEIPRLCAHALSVHERTETPSLDDVLAADRRARREVDECLTRS
ncbi:MAG: 1-deoxy-D-xylulose-5-phosphate reductoisomerase [Planctomycetota bacterium]